MVTRSLAQCSTVRRLLAAAPAVLVALVLSTGAAAGQQTLPRLDDVVTDLADVLDAGGEQKLESSLGSIAADEDVQLWALFVDTTGVEEPTAYASQTAAENGLGTNDALLMVAADDRTYALWVADGLADVTDAEIDRILGDLVEPRLVDGDWSGAAIAAAQGVVEASRGELRRPGGDGLDLTLVVVVALVVIGALLVGRALLTRRRLEAAERKERDRLAREANAALLALDEKLRDAEQELGFAEAQWGQEEVQRFRASILEATGQAKAAFAIRQRLDDREPETPAQRKAMLAEIVQRTGAAGRLIDDQLGQLDRLRDLEQTAPDQLRALGPRIEELRRRLDAAEQTLEGLTRTYAAEVVRPVSGNLVEARKALEGSRGEVERGLGAVAGGDTRSAAVAVRRAEEGVARAGELIDAVERLATDVEQARERIGALLAEVETDVATARRAIFDEELRGTDPGLPDRLAAAERLLGDARRTAAAGDADPLTALEQAEAANRSIDDVLAAVQKAEDAERRLAASLQATLASARARVDRAVDDERWGGDVLQTVAHIVGIGDRGSLAGVAVKGNAVAAIAFGLRLQLLRTSVVVTGRDIVRRTLPRPLGRVFDPIGLSRRRQRISQRRTGRRTSPYQHQPVDDLRMPDCEVLGDEPAHRDADDVRTVDSQCLQ